MFLLLILHPVLRRLYDSLHSHQDVSSSPSRSMPNAYKLPSTGLHQLDARLGRRVTFDVYFAMIFLIALHGISAVKVLLILYINFTLATQTPRAYVPVVTWVFNISILFANELCKGYPLRRLADVLAWSTSNESSKKHPYVNWGSVLDSYGGLNPRWEILFNFTVLRLISFNFDFYWRFDQAGGNPLEVCPKEPTFCGQNQMLILIRRNSSTQPVYQTEIE